MINRVPLNRDTIRVQFVLPEARLPEERVSVVGDFNAWDPAALPLRRRNNGTRSASVVLETGRRYAFRYVADSSDHWMDEETADSAEPNGYGTWNSVVVT